MRNTVDGKNINNKEDIKVGQILIVKSIVKGKSVYLEKVVKEVDTHLDGIRFSDRTWISLDKLIIDTPLHIGEIKTIFKFFKYRSYF